MKLVLLKFDVGIKPKAMDDNKNILRENLKKMINLKVIYPVEK